MADIPVYESNAETIVTVTVAGQTVLNFDFLIFRPEQIRVLYRPVAGGEFALSYPADFSVSGMSQPNGGSVHLASLSTVVGDRFLIYRKTPIERLRDWQNEGDYKADLVNAEQDEIYMILQETSRDGNVRLEREERIAGDENLQDQIDNLVGGDHGVLARYTRAGHRKSLGVNQTLESGGGWPSTPAEEINRAFSGGNPDDTLPNLAATDLGSILFMPPTEDSTNFVAPTCPWQSFGGQMRRLMPMDIRTVLYNTPVSFPLFEPVDVNGFGILTFRYIGDYPIHSIIEGTIETMVQTSVIAADASTRHMLRLACDPATVPALEVGQSQGARGLAAAVGALRLSTKMQDYREFNDPCGPVDATVIANMEANPPELFVGSDPGFFNLGDTDEALRTSDENGPVGPEVRTTKWMDCSGFDKSDRCIAMNFSGQSFRGRVQYKDSTGEIFNFGGQTRDVSAKRVYRLPHDAVQFRIYYTGRGATVDDNSMSVRALSAATSRNYDPLKGYWDRRTFSVCRDVTFWPGGVYAFEFLTLVADGGTARDTGFRFAGGGLRVTFDAGAMRKRLSSRIFKRV